MKFSFAISRGRRGNEAQIVSRPTLRAGSSPRRLLSTPRAPRVAERAFTMIEIALCLAIIGIALVAIIGVLPLGMNTQRDTRQETIINQDASMLLEAIRGGARGLDDLTNYVYAITNYWTDYQPDGTVSGYGADGYTYPSARVNNASHPELAITNGLRIVGLLGTPEYAESGPTGLSPGAPIPSLNFGGISNHVVAYIRSFSGLAAEKPPQNNQIMQEDTFTYRLFCVNAPIATDTNLFYYWPLWQPTEYSQGASVFYRWTYWQWQAKTNALATDAPGFSAPWVEKPIYPLELARSQRELRLTFLWPQLPNGNVGPFRQTFRASIGGQLVETNTPGMTLYFYQPQSFTAVP